MTTNKAPKYKAPFDTQLYSIHPDMIEVFKMNTGIVDDEALKTHLIKVSKDAFGVRVYSWKVAYDEADGSCLYIQRFPYPCISMFTHLKQVFIDMASLAINQGIQVSANRLTII